jgi:hypothetical protein
MRIRTWFKKTVIGRLVWRLIIGVIGGAITVAGAIALVGPGPGILIGDRICLGGASNGSHKNLRPESCR